MSVETVLILVAVGLVLTALAAISWRRGYAEGVLAGRAQGEIRRKALERLHTPGECLGDGPDLL